MNLMLPLKAMNTQYVDMHQPRSYWQLMIKKSKPHPFDVFSWALSNPFLWGVELKGSMTTSQAVAQCVLRGQEGRYTSACWGGFLRTSTHWVFSITLWLHTRIRKGTIEVQSTGPNKNKLIPTLWVTDRESSWPFGNFHCTYAAELLYPWALISPSAFPVTQGLRFHI